MTVWLVLASISLAWFAFQACRLFLNYRRATPIGLPLVFAPVSPDNPIWIALQTAFPSFFKHVPFGAISWLRYCRLGWEFHDRYKTHERLGDAWMLVTPDKNWLYVGQGKAAHDIFSRSRDFGRPVWMLAVLNVFGPNVSTVRLAAPPFKLTVLTQPMKAEGPDWQRQRKLTATPFNEQKSNLVWKETLSQASDMLKSWLSNDRQGLRCTADDTRQLAINVLAFAGFQKSYPFRSSAKGVAADRPSTYRDSLSIILRNALLIMVLPAKVFQLPCAPSKWSQIGWAIAVFRDYMLTQLEEERRLVADGQPGTGTLMSNLVRSSDEGAQAINGCSDARAAARPKPLTVDEILGNVFVFNFAGHDTTAISLAYSMMLLVAHSEVQDWIAEELNFHLPDGNSESWKYEDAFPKLKRCLAVLFETLRLYNPLPGVPKYTGRQAKDLRVNDQDIHIPEDTLVVPNLMALHTHPRYWGRDSLTWNPFRWIEDDYGPPSLDLGAKLSREKLFEPEKGTFIAWSDGARNCPGKKFAQVEFVATLAALFRDYRAQPVLNPGEKMAQAEKRVLDVVKDSSVELLLQMRNPRSIAVTWSSR